MIEKVPQSKWSNENEEGITTRALKPDQLVNHQHSGIGSFRELQYLSFDQKALTSFELYEQDEVLSIPFNGSLTVLDDSGQQEPLSDTRMMLAYHEQGNKKYHTIEHRDEDNSSDLINIYLQKPESSNTHTTHYVQIPEIPDDSSWRYIASPDGQAPIKLLSWAKIFDAHIKAGNHIALPTLMQFDRLSFWLFVQEGSLALNDHYLSLKAGDSLVFKGENPNFLANENSRLLLLVTNDN